MQSELLAFIAESKLLLVGGPFGQTKILPITAYQLLKDMLTCSSKEATSATVAAAEITIDYVCKNQVSLSMIHPSSKIK